MKRDGQAVGAVRLAGQAEAVFLDKVVDRDLAFVLLVGTADADRVAVEMHRLKALFGLGTHAALARRAPWPSRIATERACAERPSASPSVTAAGPMRSRLSAEHFRIEVFFM